MTTSDVLRKLIRGCVDDERTLRHESRFVGVAQAQRRRLHEEADELNKLQF
jgi:small ligand-binding sensory domain FIST